MRVRANTIIAMGPYEAVVSIAKSDGGKEEVVVDAKSIEDKTIEVGQVFSEGDRVLVELPRESATGNWRIWVPSSSIK